MENGIVADMNITNNKFYYTLSSKQMEHVKFIVLLIFVCFLTNCEKKDDFPDPGTLPKGLTGTWVETSTKTDTISFHSDSISGYFCLSRGFAMTNGYWLPKIGSDAYWYKITEDSISVISGLSSSREGGTYHFKFDEPNLTINIGKFCKYIDTKKSCLTFRKIK
ncbi:MAG: hypothetical protein NTW82_06005 [Bacteroidia bacterium]|nr:hypothetical protein [Bacteroidia bacterium]